MADAHQRLESRSESTSSSLLARVRTADQEAWQRLVALYAPLVHQWCRSARLQDNDLADVFQDVFAAVHKGIHEFRSDRPTDSFRGWLRTIVRTKVIDHFRRQSAQPVGLGGSQAAQRLNEVPESTLPSEDHSAGENQALVRHAAELVRAEFTDSTWRAFWQTAVDGKPAKEVAADLSLSVVAVRQAKSRVLRRLREEFDGLLDLS